MSRIIRAVAAAACRFSRPGRGDLKTCSGCNTQNEPERTSCIGCGARF